MTGYQLINEMSMRLVYMLRYTLF